MLGEILLRNHLGDGSSLRLQMTQATLQALVGLVGLSHPGLERPLVSLASVQDSYRDGTTSITDESIPACLWETGLYVL